MKTFFGVLISIIFVPLLVFLIIYYGLSTSIVNEKNLPETLSKYKTYETISNSILPKVLDSLASSSATTDQKQALEDISEKIKSAVTPQWLEENFSKAYSYIVSYLKGDIDTSDMEIDLGVISKIFTPQELATSFISSDDLKKQFEELPICTSNQKDNCRNADLTFSQYQEMLSSSIEESQTGDEAQISIPEKINLYDLLNSKNNSLENVKNMYSLSGKIALILVGLEVLLVLILVIMFFGDPKRLFKYLGYNFIIPGIILLLISVIPISSSSLVSKFLPTNDIPNIYGPELVSMLVGIVQSLFNRILIFSIILIVIGIVLFILSKKIQPVIELQKENIK